MDFPEVARTPAASQANLMAKNRASVSVFPVNVAVLATFTSATASSLFLWTCVYDRAFE